MNDSNDYSKAELERLKKERAEVSQQLDEAEEALHKMSMAEVDQASQDLREAREDADQRINELGRMDEDDYRLAVHEIETEMEELQFESPITRPAVLENMLERIDDEIEKLS